MRNKKSNRGYIALSSILVISAIVLVIGISTSLLSVNDLLSSFSGEKSNESIDFVEACVEDALLRLNENNSLPANISLPQGTCSVTINSQIGNNWDFTVSGTLNGYQKNINLQAVRDTAVSITGWLEN